jgi:hypothetical protein
VIHRQDDGADLGPGGIQPRFIKEKPELGRQTTVRSGIPSRLAVLSRKMVLESVTLLNFSGRLDWRRGGRRRADELLLNSEMGGLERETGFEPATLTLARMRSTVAGVQGVV